MKWSGDDLLANSYVNETNGDGGWSFILGGGYEERFFYCTHTIPRETYDLLPGRCGLDFLAGGDCSNPVQAVREMVENALRFAVADYRKRGVEPAVAFIREGPYAIPYLKTGKAAAC